MLLKNLDTASGLVNGTRGRIIGFVEHENSMYPVVPEVEFYCTVGDVRSVQTVKVKEETWDIRLGER